MKQAISGVCVDRHTFLPSAFSVFSVAALLGCTRDLPNMTITVQAGEKQTIAGLGASAGLQGINTMARESRMKMASLLWKGADFRILRLWSEPTSDGMQFGTVRGAIQPG